MSETYEGEFLKGKQHGKGLKTWKDGSQYTGEYKEGVRDGVGRATYADGTIYQGHWTTDKRHDQSCKDTGAYKPTSCLTWPKLAVSPPGFAAAFETVRPGRAPVPLTYTGSFMDDEIHGDGTLKFAGGDEYMGEFKTIADAPTFDGNGRLSLTGGRRPFRARAPLLRPPSRPKSPSEFLGPHSCFLHPFFFLSAIRSRFLDLR
jgi:hypothetical protein